ncbi:MAG TPA: aminopeptidase [Thermotogota bacterium]|nr:aminopeptidase [Thermotogota bacterium]
MAKKEAVGNPVKDLQKKLRREPVSVWSKREKEAIFAFNEEYKRFLFAGTTERTSVNEMIRLAEKDGYIAFEAFLKNPPKKLEGQKIYYNNRGKSVAFWVLGKDIADGINFVAAHIDSPRLDLKPVPLYEDTELCLAKTHYYGGIKKYQWFNVPLGIDGVVIKANGEKVAVRIGFEPGDPIFVISDLLPHLDRREGDIQKVFQAETLNVLLGSIPFTFDKTEGVKDLVLLNILNLLNEKYGFVEEDLFSAELEIVPAIEPKDVGFDRSLLAAYGHDDRVCAYTASKALFDARPVSKTACAILLDKEEIGSVGSTGAIHTFWKKLIKHLLPLYRSELSIDTIIERSMVISADVAAGINPSFKDVHEANNAAKLGYGITITKYTGRGGKGGASDAHAEIVGHIRNLFNDKGIVWQNGLLGKVDLGGGGTVAQFFANEGLSVIDAGVAVLGMHSPYEIVSKADVYETYLAYKVFFENSK